LSRGLAKLPIIGAVLGAIGASLCCGGPLVLLVAGASGACISSLRFLYPYRPYFIGFSLVSLGIAFYAVYFRKVKTVEGAYCRYPRVSKYSKMLLWLVTVLVLFLIAFPYIF